MSLRDSSYDSFTLLSNASPTDNMTVEEYSALIEFQEIAKKIEAEQEKLNSLVSFLQSSSSQNAPQSIKDFTQHQIDASTSIISNLSKQAKELETSTVLRPLVENLIVQTFNEEVKRVRREMDEATKKEYEEVFREWRQKRAIAVAAYEKQLGQQQKENSPAMLKAANDPKPIHKKKKHTFFDNVFAAIGGIMLVCSVFFLACLMLIPKQPPKSKTGTEVATAPPAIATTAPTVPKETLMPHGRPESGSISIGRPYDSAVDSEITIHASSKNCVVKLKTTDGITILSFFVRANETATVGVPAKKLYAFFAEGDTWYGWSDYFGENTLYSKDPDPVDFSQYTIEYTLHDVYNGNLNLSNIDEDEF